MNFQSHFELRVFRDWAQILITACHTTLHFSKQKCFYWKYFQLRLWIRVIFFFYLLVFTWANYYWETTCEEAQFLISYISTHELFAKSLFTHHCWGGSLTHKMLIITICWFHSKVHKLSFAQSTLFKRPPL